MSPVESSKRGRGRRKPMAEINVVPYIDVTLVLLIIFMITTPMLQTGVKVDLPKAESATVEQKDDPPLVVTIDKQEQYFISNGDGKDEPVQPEEISARVTAVLSGKPQTQVLINADETLDYGKVVKVMAELKRTGLLSNVGLMTKPEDK
jgi:biopolymer transport protein TolR